MNIKKIENSFESNKKISLSPPAVELFSDPSRVAEAWPEQIANNKEFLNQLESRKELNERLDMILSSLPRPDMPLQEAISKNCLTENQVAELYESLSDLINDDDYKRIIFYLPFEFLPSKTWTPSSKELQQGAERFRAAYMTVWDNLLSIQDVRANFVDGDVLEIRSRVGDLPRVVKAAHLIPKLIEKGFLNVEDIFKLIETSDDEILKQSIADTLPVLFDLGFLQQEDLARIKASDNLYVRSKAELIVSSAGKVGKQETTTIKNITLQSIQKQIDNGLRDIDVEEYGDVAEKRKAWLKQEKRKKVIESVSEDIKTAITSDALSNEEVARFIAPNASLESKQTFIDGVRKSIESIECADTQQAQTVYAKYDEMLMTLWERDINIPEIKDALSKTFCRLHGLGIVTSEQLSALGITIPALAGPFSKNLNTMKEEIDDIQNIVTLIESDADISRYIYPVVLVFGSRLKGYGNKDSDIDVGVFVKPGVSTSDMGKLRALLKKNFAHKKIQGEIIEFWLEKNGNELRVRDFDETETSTGESYSHALFGAVWEGNQDTINELRQKLLVPYLYDEEKTIYGRDARGLYIEELERDTLQYRLMHKGYEKFFPSYGGINTPHADQIDGQSVFWDSGYRQMATKLYASRVFLPKVSKHK